MNREKPSAGKRTPGLWLSATLVLCCALLFAAGCTGPQQAGVKTNDTIQVFYTVSFPDGTEFQSNVNGTPLEFTVGSGDVIPGFDEAVIGMTPGMTKIVTVSPEKGYGPHNASLVYVLGIEDARAMNKDLQEKGTIQVINYPSIGPVALWQGEEGQSGYLRFTNTTLETTTVDMNHPLAGRDLVFEITLVEIVEKTS
jgi:peptidylprolyl isomerase